MTSFPPPEPPTAQPIAPMVTPADPIRGAAKGWDSTPYRDPKRRRPLSRWVFNTILLALLLGIVALIAGWWLGGVHVKKSLEPIAAAEQNIARRVVGDWSGAERIQFNGYRTEGVLAKHTSYEFSVNGVEVSVRVKGNAGWQQEFDSIELTPTSVTDQAAADEGWLGGNREAGVKKRDSPQAAADISMDGVRVGTNPRDLSR